MGEVQFYDDKVLFVSGQVAMHEDCCCVWSGSCGDCNCGWDDLSVTAVITSNKEPFPPDPVDLETCVASETVEDTDTSWGDCFWLGERTAVGCNEIEGVANWGAVVGFTIYTWREEYQVWQESYFEVLAPLSLTSCDGKPVGSGSTWMEWPTGCHVDFDVTVG